MRLSRSAPAVALAGTGGPRSRVALWALVGALGVVCLLFMATSGWRGTGLRAGVFCALAAIVPEFRRPRVSGLMDLAIAILACLVEYVARSSLAGLLVGVAASAAGWSLGRSALALSGLSVTGTGPFAMSVETTAVTWFTALQRTPPERFDWSGLERWMRAHPSHRDAYERVETLWYAESAEATPGARRRWRDAFGGLSRAAAVAKLGLWLAPIYTHRLLVFSAAVVLSVIAVYA